MNRDFRLVDSGKIGSRCIVPVLVEEMAIYLTSLMGIPCVGPLHFLSLKGSLFFRNLCRLLNWPLTCSNVDLAWLFLWRSVGSFCSVSASKVQKDELMSSEGVERVFSEVMERLALQKAFWCGQVSWSLVPLRLRPLLRFPVGVCRVLIIQTLPGLVRRFPLHPRPLHFLLLKVKQFRA